MHRSYITNVRKATIASPGDEKLAAIAKATAKEMGLPPELWFEEDPSAPTRGASEARGGLAGRVERLFEVVRDPKTAEAYTNEGIAHKSLGELTADGIEEVRSGAVADHPLSHLLALAREFGVEPSYLVDGTGEAVIDAELVDALKDDMTREMATESARLRVRERKLVLGIVREFEGMGANDRPEPQAYPADRP